MAFFSRNSVNVEIMQRDFRRENILNALCGRLGMFFALGRISPLNEFSQWLRSLFISLKNSFTSFFFEFISITVGDVASSKCKFLHLTDFP